MTKRQIPISFLLATAVVVFSSGCKKAEAPDEKPVTSVEVEKPETGPVSEDVTADAVLYPLAQAAIVPKITSPIKTYYVQRGSHVHAGQLLATLENQDVQASALDTQGSYLAARGAFTQATRGAAPEELTRSRLEVEQAKAAYNLDQSIYQARQQLFSQGAIPGRDLDNAKNQALKDKAALDLAQQHYSTLQGSGNRANLESAQGTLESAKGKYLGAQAQLSYTELRSPINGVVTERPLFPGETAPVGTAALTVMDTSVLIAKCHIAQEQAAELKVGAQASLMVPGEDTPVVATVSLISPALDTGSSTIEVWLKVPNKDGDLKPGSSVHATIHARTVEDALNIPNEAIQRSPEGDGKIVMLAMPDGTAKKRAITIGIQSKQDTQILSGLKPTDQVITRGAFGLDDGSKIKIEAPEAAEGADADDKGAGAADDAKGGK
jgi:HlyD family secretion protein